MLSFARSAIRFANVLNWVLGAIVAALIGVMVFAADTIRNRRAETYGIGAADYPLVVLAVALVLPVVPLVHAIFVRLRSLIDSADTDRCFSDVNARRLVVIAWCLIGINLIDLAFGTIDLVINPDGTFGWFPTLTGWFAAMLLFVLAGIFRKGAAMRADLEGTV